MSYHHLIVFDSKMWNTLSNLHRMYPNSILLDRCCPFVNEYAVRHHMFFVFILIFPVSEIVIAIDLDLKFLVILLLQRNFVNV